MDYFSPLTVIFRECKLGCVIKERSVLHPVLQTHKVHEGLNSSSNASNSPTQYCIAKMLQVSLLCMSRLRSVRIYTVVNKD